MLVDLEGEDLRGSTGTCNGDGEQADGPASRDGHGFGGDVAGEDCMYRIAQRVENRCILLRNGRVELPDIALGDNDILGEGTIGVDTNDLYVLTDVRFSNAALQALAAGDVHLGRDEVAFLHAGDVFAYGFHDAAKLVAGDERRVNTTLSPLVPVVDVQVGAADRSDLDIDEDFIGSKFGAGNFTDLCAGSRLRLYDSKHGIGHENDSRAATKRGE